MAEDYTTIKALLNREYSSLNSDNEWYHLENEWKNTEEEKALGIPQKRIVRRVFLLTGILLLIFSFNVAVILRSMFGSESDVGRNANFIAAGFRYVGIGLLIARSCIKVDKSSLLLETRLYGSHSRAMRKRQAAYDKFKQKHFDVYNRHEQNVKRMAEIREELERLNKEQAIQHKSSEFETKSVSYTSSSSDSSPLSVRSPYYYQKYQEYYDMYMGKPSSTSTQTTEHEKREKFLREIEADYLYSDSPYDFGDSSML